MKEWPSGSYIVLECRGSETNVDSVAISFKYNWCEVQCFCMMWDAATTRPGKPCSIKFSVKYRNVKEQKVTWPEAIGEFFADSNAIDSHTQYWQDILKLEELWKMSNPWFWANTSYFGQTIVDCYQSIMYHQKLLKGWTLREFAGALTYDCILIIILRIHHKTTCVFTTLWKAAFHKHFIFAL